VPASGIGSAISSIVGVLPDGGDWRSPMPSFTNIVILAALLSSAAGCSHCVGMAPTGTSPGGGPSRELLTFSRTNPFFGRGYKLVLFDDGCLEYDGAKGHDEVFVEPPAMAKVRSSLERLAALPPDCCNCMNMTDQPWTFMTFQVPGGTGTKKIDHYEACRETPDWVFDVEDEIEDALGAERWVLKRVFGRARHSDRP
jgi:hypothetical protein